MGSRTIRLDASTYERLKAARRPGESFSQVVCRLLDEHEPSFLDFRGLLDQETVGEVRKAIGRMKEEDLRIQERKRVGASRSKWP